MRLFMPDVKGYGFKWSPDGRQVAFNLLSDQGLEIWVAGSDGTRPHPVTKVYDDIGVQAWLNDHMLLIRIRPDVTERYDDIHYVLDLHNEEMQPYSESLERSIPLPSGNQWVAWNLHSGLILYTLGQDPQKLFVDFWIEFLNFDVSPSGRDIVACGILRASDGTTNLYRWEIDRTVESAWTYALDSCGSVRWSPDGKHFALLKDDETLVIFDATTNKIEYEYAIGPLTVSSFVWSSDGDAVLVSRYYGESDSSLQELASVNIEIGTITRLTNNDIIESSPQWVIIR
jgi:Tol biopolymer transport system component